jgi:hypothetical protein
MVGIRYADKLKVNLRNNSLKFQATSYKQNAKTPHAVSHKLGWSIEHLVDEGVEKEVDGGGDEGGNRDGEYPCHEDALHEAPTHH